MSLRHPVRQDSQCIALNLYDPLAVGDHMWNGTRPHVGCDSLICKMFGSLKVLT